MGRGAEGESRGAAWRTRTEEADGSSHQRIGTDGDVDWIRVRTYHWHAPPSTALPPPPTTPHLEPHPTAPQTANWSPWLVALYVTFVGLLVAVGGVGLLLKGHSMHLVDAFASVVVWCLASSAILRFADQVR